MQIGHVASIAQLIKVEKTQAVKEKISLHITLRNTCANGIVVNKPKQVCITLKGHGIMIATDYTIEQKFKYFI